jgi:demethylmenaquinone methyltransferase/2-methoxy-6-polyprenyl-1,4-benzoquinol methylase
MVRDMVEGKKMEADFGFRRVPVDEKATLVGDVFGRVATRYDLMNDVMSAGVHRLWKRALIDSLRPRKDAHLLDVAGGTGDIATRFLDQAAQNRARWSSAKVTLCDINPSMLGQGRDRMIDRGVPGAVALVCGDAEQLPFADASVDAVTIAFGIRNVTKPRAALEEMRRVLRPGGQFLCLEFSHVATPGLEAIYEAYSFHVIPALGELIAQDRDAYAYLVESVRRFPDQDTFAGMIAGAGFGQVKFRNLSGGIAAIHSGWRT